MIISKQVKWMLTIFVTLIGFSGLLLAVPLAATIGVIVRFGLAEYKKSSLFTDNMKD